MSLEIWWPRHSQRMKQEKQRKLLEIVFSHEVEAY
jgi:hypothetical protein